MYDVNSTSLICPFCDTLVDKCALHCDKCDHWVHYSWSKLPPPPPICNYSIKNHQDCSRATLVSMNVLRMTFMNFILKLKEVLPSTPIIATLPTLIIATSSHLDISRSQASPPTSVVLTPNPSSVVLTRNPHSVRPSVVSAPLSPSVRVPHPSIGDLIGTLPVSYSKRVTSVATSTDPPSFVTTQISAQSLIQPSPIKPPCHVYSQG